MRALFMNRCVGVRWLKDCGLIESRAGGGVGNWLLVDSCWLMVGWQVYYTPLAPLDRGEHSDGEVIPN